MNCGLLNSGGPVEGLKCSVAEDVVRDHRLYSGQDWVHSAPTILVGKQWSGPYGAVQAAPSLP